MRKWSTECSSEFSRCTPTQQRSRERYQSILNHAVQIIKEKGVDGLRMSDIVERANVPCGSLYQYFPDKTAVIGTLAEHFNAEGHNCVKAELQSIQTMDDLHPALCRITDGYFQVLLHEPVMRDIWHATQTDRVLQDLDRADKEILSSYLLEVLQRLKPQSDPQRLMEFSRFIMHLIAAAVRYAIIIEKEEGQRAIALFKNLLPTNVDNLAP
jgi:AcrR family transcriptional regulator